MSYNIPLGIWCLRASQKLGQVIVAVTFLAWPAFAWQPPYPVSLQDITSDTNIDFVHSDGSSGKRFIVETLASGLATLDYDLDGKLDIYFLSAPPLDNPSLVSTGRNRLYRNEGNAKFYDATEVSQSGDLGFGLGVAVADYDNDGWPDIYISNFGQNKLYHNLGDGTFQEVAESLGVQCGQEVGAGVSFADINGDGLLDLYVANYVDFQVEKHIATVVDGVERYSSPKVYQPQRDYLFLNNGESFSDISASSGIANHIGTGMGMIAFDADEDGDQDIIVLNDVRPNFLFQNDAAGKFEEIGLLSGLAFNFQGNVLGSMGIDAADFDQDGLIDLFQTSFATEMPVLRKNLGGGYFDDVTRTAGLGLASTAQTNWGTCFLDVDNDTRMDLFVANGHLFDNIELFDDRSDYEQPNQLFWNQGSGRFVDISSQAGSAMQIACSSRGSVVGDINNDGTIDIIISNSRKAPTVLKNETNPGHHWISLALHGTVSNRDAVGAIVSLTAGSITQTQTIHSGRGYQSHWGTLLHFGLGTQTKIDSITVTWPSGLVEKIDIANAVDTRIDIVEGRKTAVSR